MDKVSFYTPAGETSPIKKFLDACQPTLRVKILRQLQYIQDYGLNPAVPNLKKITRTPLWELRILGKDNVRIICLSLPKKEVIVLHLFKKKKEKTPLKEINLALERDQEILNKLRYICDMRYKVRRTKKKKRQAR